MQSAGPRRTEHLFARTPRITSIAAQSGTKIRAAQNSVFSMRVRQMHRLPQQKAPVYRVLYIPCLHGSVQLIIKKDAPRSVLA